MRLSSVRELKNQLLARSEIHALVSRLVPEFRRSPVALGVCRAQQGYRLAVRVQHTLPGIQALVDQIASRARGEVEVRVVGRVFKQAPWYRGRNRPLRVGGSLGHHAITAGTLGAFVTRGDGHDLILSNNHVLANENRGRVGDPILQPGPTDGGRRPRDCVARLEKYVHLRSARINRVDCAMAALEEDVEYFANWLERLGPIAGVRTAPLEEAEPVFKLGRTTGRTRGRISAVEVDELEVGFDAGDLSFDDQIEIEPAGNVPFSLGGDSGSLIVDEERRAVGLLFAGNDADATYANPIRAVLDALGVELT